MYTSEELQQMIDSRVAETLSSLGADMLSTYGHAEKASEPGALAMAKLGGYLLERFGG